MSTPVKRDAVSVLVKELDQAKTDQVNLQLRLESQVQEREIELLQSMKKVDSVTARLKSTQEEAKNLKTQLQKMEGQLQEETVKKTQLQKMVQALRERLHFAEAERVNAKNTQEDIEKRLVATEARIYTLENELLAEKEKLLETEFKWERKLLTQVLEANSSVIGKVLISSMGTGIWFGGWIGAGATLVGNLVWIGIEDFPKREKKIKERLEEIDHLEKSLFGAGAVEKRLVALEDKFLDVSPMEKPSQSDEKKTPSVKA